MANALESRLALRGAQQATKRHQEHQQQQESSKAGDATRQQQVDAQDHKYARYDCEDDNAKYDDNDDDDHDEKADKNQLAATISNKNKSDDDHDQAADDKRSSELVWFNIFLFVVLHASLPTGLYLIWSQRPWKTVLFSVLGMYVSGVGVTAGSHRLWSHRAYRARWPVELLLMAMQTMAGQNSIYTWSRDHRLHHKYSETNADPHNIKRGFFFAHMGWLCCRKHPDVARKGAQIDMTDLQQNPIVAFQHRHFWWLSLVFTVALPTAIPVLLWREHLWTSFILSFMVRYCVTLHGTWLVNSAAHYIGRRPYDKRLESYESPYVICTGIGEGFHNYHHTFPYDYAASEFGHYFNITTAFIDLCASLGLVYGRRSVDATTIAKRRLRTGDLEQIDELERAELIELAATKDNNNQTARDGDASSRRLDTKLASNNHLLAVLKVISYRVLGLAHVMPTAAAVQRQ